jgi:MFS family permease
LTGYASWRWIFYLNLPIGLIGGGLAWWLLENYRAPAPARFDLAGFAIAGAGLFLLQFAIENLARPILAPALGAAFLPLALVALWAYRRHARASPAPVLDLKLLAIPTFRTGMLTGGLCRMGLDAPPFLLPLLFQVGFGLSPLAAGLLSFSATAGAMLVRGFSQIVLRRLGFRRTLVGGAVAAAAVSAGFALLDAGTPHWFVVLLVLLSGCIRSLQNLALNAISFAEMPPALLSRATGISGVVQQVARGFGVAIGAALLAVVAGPERGVTTGDFHVVFVLVALIPLSAAIGFRRLSPVAGAEVSGHTAAAAKAA